MQTLKTAAIVVLLMAVMYSAYVSMTAPPEELPPELNALVMDTDEFSIDPGLPDPLDSIAFADAPSPAPDYSSVNASNTPPSFSNELLNDLAATATSKSQSDFGSAGTFADAPTQDLLGGERMASRDLHGLPHIDGNSTVTADPDRNYPNTGASFVAPNPGDVAKHIAKR